MNNELIQLLAPPDACAGVNCEHGECKTQVGICGYHCECEKYYPINVINRTCEGIIIIINH